MTATQVIEGLERRKMRKRGDLLTVRDTRIYFLDTLVSVLDTLAYVLNTRACFFDTTEGNVTVLDSVMSNQCRRLR